MAMPHGMHQTAQLTPAGTRVIASEQRPRRADLHTVVEEIVEHSGTPYFCFKDIDENKPTGSIKIRVETIGYFLKRYREDMVAAKQKKHTIDAQLAEYEKRLRLQLLKEKLAALEGEEYAGGAMPKIHVSIGALAASRPQAPMSASGD